MEWQRIDLDHQLRNVGGGKKAALVHRVYGKDGKLWPRIVLSIYPDCDYCELKEGDVPKRFKVSASYKRDMESCDIFEGVPWELLPELLEMIQDLNTRFSS